jgi:hypothetical protein
MAAALIIGALVCTVAGLANALNVPTDSVGYQSYVVGRVENGLQVSVTFYYNLAFEFAWERRLWQSIGGPDVTGARLVGEGGSVCFNCGMR